MADSPAKSVEDSSAGATPIEDEATLDELLEHEARVLVDFYADWCGPCQMMADTVDQLGRESDAAVVKVDVEALPQIANRYNVRSLPTFIAFANGEPSERLVGVHELGTLAAAVE